MKREVLPCMIDIRHRSKCLLCRGGLRDSYKSSHQITNARANDLGETDGIGGMTYVDIHLSFFIYK